jgi:hypothetical protein
MNTNGPIVNGMCARGALHCVKRDRVQPGMTGKFLPFKYYGAKGNELAYGVKEE